MTQAQFLPNTSVPRGTVSIVNLERVLVSYWSHAMLVLDNPSSTLEAIQYESNFLAAILIGMSEGLRLAGQYDTATDLFDLEMLLIYRSNNLGESS